MIANLVFGKTSASANHPNCTFFISEKDGVKYYSYVVRNKMARVLGESNVMRRNGIASERSFEMENVVFTFMSFELLRADLFQTFGLFAVMENGKMKVCSKDECISTNGILSPSENASFYSLEELADAASADPDCEVCGTGYIQFVMSYFDESGNGMKFQQVKTASGETVVKDYTTGKTRVLGAKDKAGSNEMPIFRAWQVLSERAEHRVWTAKSKELEKPSVAEGIAESVLEQKAERVSVDLD